MNTISIGGVGGSGTRLIASILQSLDYNLGSDLNQACDNLLFTLLFKDPKFIRLPEHEVVQRYALLKKCIRGEDLIDEDLKLIKSCVNERPLHSVEWLKERARRAISRKVEAAGELYGWKEPNTHVFIDKLIKYDSSLTYIHVVRNGLDMSYSSNQNQLKIWSEHFLGQRLDYTPENSFQYWVSVHENILLLKKRFPERVHILNYDNLINLDANEIKLFIKFIGNENCPIAIEKINSLVTPPKSVGRYKKSPLFALRDNDKNVMKQLGFQY